MVNKEIVNLKNGLGAHTHTHGQRKLEKQISKIFGNFAIVCLTSVWT